MKSDTTYDIMLSYRRAESAAEARRLKDYLDELKVSAWFDILNLPQNTIIPEEKLKQSLESAVRASRLIVQFRFHQPIDRSAGDIRLTFAWPFFERQFAKELVTVMIRSPGPSLLLSSVGDVHPFYDLAHLGYLLALTVGRTDNLDEYWQRYMVTVESDLGIRADIYGVVAWHTLDWKPDIIDPDKPEARRNVLPHKETPDIHPEVVQGHELHTFDGMHCWRCGHRFGIMACVLIWLIRDNASCYQCYERLSYNQQPLDRLLAFALLIILSFGIWGLFFISIPRFPALLRAGVSTLVGFILAFNIWGLYLQKWRTLVKGD